MPATTHTRAIIPAERTRDIKYAVRDVVILANQVAATGRQMLYLNIGDPNVYDFVTPPHIVEATHRAMLANKNGYGPSSGIPEAIEAIKGEARRKGISSICHTFVTSGASEGIELALSALANPGDNVLTPSPGYPLYTAVLAKIGVVNRAYYLDEDDQWQPDINDIRAKINDRTRAIVLINPNNPTGSLCTPGMLQQLVDLCIERNLILISDEIYDKLVFDGRTHVSTASLSSELKCITFNGLSKSYVVPGFRIGWGIISGPADELEDYCEAIRKMERARLCANHPEQYAIKPALQGSQDHIEEMIGRLQRRRDLTVSMLNDIDGVSCVSPGGAFYAFPSVYLSVPDDEFVQHVIRETGVVIVPGSGFGQRPGTGHFRVVFLPPDEILSTAFQRLADIVRKFRA